METKNEPPFQVKTFGIILGTERFEECVHFYRDTLGLPVWFEKERLVCLRYGDGYLMVETGGVARNHRKPNKENPTTLRLNVEDVESAAAALRERGVEVEIKSFSWGTVGIFMDPDGNACELKNADDPYFA
ncbi:VOC family protein [Chelativorans salis]|uniref:VOC family protein n=1 Tax=Chelativorans salis TaxID=2978478 RepID=A0ABT2LSH4_9HYPH|nr:VOC family protein [Chelativorans sp. EGI FJ00035]MCT7377039.1 VOC family protein [Chelativorans sp. EGI FJ00035]